jgi:hypothetical protein
MVTVGLARARMFLQRIVALAIAITGMQVLLPSFAAGRILLFEDLARISHGASAAVPVRGG